MAVSEQEARAARAVGSQPEPSMARRIIGMILLTLGVLLTIGSGACTGLFLIGFALDDGGSPEFSGGGLLLAPLVIGGPFILIGALMWWGGAKLRSTLPPGLPPPWVKPPPPPGAG